MNQEESYIHGILAFPLLELGRMEEAAVASRKGYEINKEDAWAHHCVSISNKFLTHCTCVFFLQLPCDAYVFFVVAAVSCSSS